MLQDNKKHASRDVTGTKLTTDFLPLMRRNIHALKYSNKHFFSNDSKSFHTTQTTISLIHSKKLYKHGDTTYTTDF